MGLSGLIDLFLEFALQIFLPFLYRGIMAHGASVQILYH
jgi:hypothetical protein